MLLDSAQSSKLSWGPEQVAMVKVTQKRGKGCVVLTWERFPGSASLILLSQRAAAKNTTALRLQRWKKQVRGGLLLSHLPAMHDPGGVACFGRWHLLRTVSSMCPEYVPTGKVGKAPTGLKEVRVSVPLPRGQSLTS